MKNFETTINPEKKNDAIAPSIRLEIFRHDDKEKTTDSGARLGDNEVHLSPAGRVNAVRAGRERNPHPAVGLVYGSPRERTRETALRGLLSNEDITVEDSFTEMEEKINKEMGYGRKHIIDNRLNFIWDGEQVSRRFHDEGYDHFLNKKDALKWLFKDSDQVVLEEKDPVATSYSRCAGNIAELVKKYMDILPRWENITKIDAAKPAEEKKNYADFQNELQRFMGSHAAVLENFLLKVIEKKEGRAGVEKFFEQREASQVGNNSFKPNEGYTISIVTANGQPTAEVIYHDKNWQLSLADLEGMIADRDKLNKEISS